MRGFGAILGGLCCTGVVLPFFVYLAVVVGRPLKDGERVTGASRVHAIVVLCVAVATMLAFPVFAVFSERGMPGLSNPEVIRDAAAGLVIGGIPIVVAGFACVIQSIRVINKFKDARRDGEQGIASDPPA